VSTILKALQKLEREKASARPSGSTPVFSRPQSTAGGLTGWFLNSWGRWAVMGLTIVALSVVAIHFHLQSRSHERDRADRAGAREKPAAVAGAYQNQARVPAPESIAKEDPSRLGIGSTGHSDQLAVEPPPKIAIPGSRATGVTPNLELASQRTIPKAPESQAQDDSGQASTQALGPSRDPNIAISQPRPADIPASETPPPLQDGRVAAATPAKSAGKTGSANAVKAPADAFKNTPILTDGRLKVHAIAWASPVEERMAVVNNRVIYEGDFVDNFVIVTIRPDDVVVREKEKGLWRVVFGRP
jgi:hypothetical protein